MSTEQAYCGKCGRMVEYTGTRCNICNRPIWELLANVPGPKSPKLRTIAASEAALTSKA